MYKIFERLCEKNGITPYRVCKDTGLTTSMISNWKAGRYEPKADKIKILADYFGVSPEYLRTGHEPEKNDYYLDKEAAKMAERLYKNEDLRILFDATIDVSSEDLKTVTNLLRSLQKKERGDID